MDSSVKGAHALDPAYTGDVDDSSVNRPTSKGPKVKSIKFLDDLKSYGSIGKKLADLAEHGNFDEAFDLFRNSVLKKK